MRPHRSPSLDQLPTLRRPARRRVVRCALAAGVFALAIPLSHPAAAEQSEDTLKPFQPGVEIDWNAPAVHVAGRVILTAGPLEFAACFPGKEHESVVLLDATATHVFMALGLIGLEPGHPPKWNPQQRVFEPAAGAPVRVQFRWVADGETRTVDAHQWIRDRRWAQPPVAKPWIFAGSKILPARRLAADATGAGIALVEQEEVLLAYPRAYPSDLANLWADAHTPAIPPRGTSVTTILSPAGVQRIPLRLDFRGQLWNGEQPLALADLAALVRLNRSVAPDFVQPITAPDVLAALKQRIEVALPTGAVKWTNEPSEAEGGANAAKSNNPAAPTEPADDR